MPLRKPWGLPLLWLIALIKLPTSFEIVKTVFTLYKIAFASARKPHRVSDLFTHKTVRFRRNFCNRAKLHCSALHCTYLKIESHIGQVFTFLEMETRATKMVACENIRFSSLFAAGETTKMAGGELNAWRVKPYRI